MPKQTFFNLSDEKKDNIRQSVYAVFNHKPYDEVTITDITKTAGIPVGSFYRYFIDKDDLYIYFFFEIELKMLEKGFATINTDILPQCSEHYLDGFTEEEIEFDNTWFKIPTPVMRKFYFGEYDSSLIDYFREHFYSMYENKLFRDDLEPELALYLYVTSTFNLYMYMSKNNIVCPDEVKRIKGLFFDKIFPYGILKNNK